jgi:large subunit ribosomal protein L21
MFAIIEIAGQQFKVEKDQKLYVHHINEADGASLEFDKVLLVGNGSKISVGTPGVKGAKVTATVLNQMVKGDKVIVFKKKRRKGYKKKNGHRQQFTQIQIGNITV